MSCNCELIDFEKHQKRTIELIQEIGETYNSDEYSPELIKDRLIEMLKLPYFLIGLFKDGNLIGLSGALVLTKMYSGKQIEIDNFVISKEHRGNNYGSILLDAVKAKDCFYLLTFYR